MREKAATIISLVLCAVLFFCTCSFSQPPEEKMRVAVVEFDEKGDLGIPDAGEIVAEWMITALVKTGRYVVEERPLLERILRERQLALTDIYELNPESLAKLRDEYKMDALLVGAIMKFGNTISIVGKLVDIRSFEIINAGKVSTTQVDEVEQIVGELARELSGIKAALTERRAILQITSDPKGASIYIDESYFGLTPKQIDELSPGSHAVKLIKPGYKEYRTEVLLMEGREALIEEKLERKPRPKLKSPLMARIIALPPPLGCLGLGHFYAGDRRTGWWILGASALAGLIASTTDPPETYEILIAGGAWLFDLIHAPIAAIQYNKRVTREYEQSLSSNLGLYTRDNKIFLVLKGAF